MAGRYPIRIGARSAPLLRVAFGVTRDRAHVEVGPETIAIRFGWYGLTVPIARVSGWRIEGPWRWITAIGVRRSIRHGDITFCGSPRGGVRLDLDPPLRWEPLTLPAIYVGVEDLEGFAAELTQMGVGGVDARTA